MDAAAWLEDNARFRTPEGTFACREGCGFCCTYPPKVHEDRLRAIEASAGPTPSARDERGNLRLALQGGCGGCVLLEERVCRAHEHRPDHCRFFPFHVYFGRRVEVLADRVCPGLAPEDAPAGPHQPARQAPAWEAPRGIEEAGRDVMAQADVDELDTRAGRAREVHEAVAAQARWAGEWRDPDRAVEALVDHAEVTDRAWQQAREPFEATDVAQLPTAVLPDGEGFPWRAWRMRDGELERLRFDEEGRTKLVGVHAAPSPPAGRRLGPEVAAVLAELADLEAFVGASMHLVEQGLGVNEAVKRRLDDVAAGLSLHAGLLEIEGLPVTSAWLRSVYEPEFFSLATLGEWL